MTEAPSSPPDPAVPAPRARASRSGRTALAAVLLVVAVTAAMAAWLGYDARRDLQNLREEVAQRLRDADAESRAARIASRDAQEAVREFDRRLSALQARVAESQSQQMALESLFRELAQTRDDWLLAEVEQTLIIASRELQLAGNVRAALAALEAAEARLAREERPQFLPVRQAIARDIERLRATPNLDLVGLTLRIDQLIAAADTLPLLAEGRPHGETGELPEADAVWWRTALRAVWEELKSLVRIQRFDAQDNALLAPDQAWFLRENLRLTLMHARLALLARNEHAYRTDIEAATAMVKRYFDARQKAVESALAALGQLSAAKLAVQLPTVNDSLAALRTARAPRDRAGR